MQIFQQDDPTSEATFIRHHIRSRNRLSRHFDNEIFVDPPLMILLHLYLAQGRREEMSVKKTCIVAGVPHTTGLRWIADLETYGLIERSSNPNDGRSVLISLTEQGCRSVRAWAIDAMPKSGGQ